ncbi:hypothetical protein QBC43DRAFT_324900 [Cladorrhinum sp. PSN259]|nr:hypothetical protein QBC43DRAFT_324900 [Cladorrhinum sp. PSN259]
MVRASSIFFSAGLAAVTAAQRTTVTLLLPLGDTQTIFGSVIAANPTATTYSVNCPPGMDSNDCGLGTGLRVISGPKTVSVDMGMEGASANFGCKIEPETAVCSGTLADTESTVVTTETLSASDLKDLYAPVTITAGAEKLAAATGGAGVTTTSSSGPAPTGTGTGGTTLTKVSSTGSAGNASQTQSSSTSTGGVPHITQNAVLMGAAALVGAMMI